MSAATRAVGIGLARGWTEFRQGLSSPPELGSYVTTSGALLTVLFFQRDSRVDGTSLTLATLTLAGALGFLIPMYALNQAAYTVAMEREDGTLLRAKAVPHGMIGYLSGQSVRLSLITLLGLVCLLVPGLVIVDGIEGIGWFTLAWVAVLGLLSSVSIGLIIGSLASSPRAVGNWGFLLMGGLTAISGIFYPITALAGWLQSIAQVFPVYWLGLGVRSALLPESAAAAEIGQSWRPGATAAVLGAWAIAGLLCAPSVLRRMARRESGSRVEERRRKAMQRSYA